MNNLQFEKVSFNQFAKDYRKNIRADILDEELKNIYEKITLPKRSTIGSAGYDFVTPAQVNLTEESNVTTIPTGIRIVMPENCFLAIVPRSGLGFKTGMRLANTVGIIDSDYQFSDNEGHIMVKLVRGFKDCQIEAFDRFVQGIIMSYVSTLTDSEDEKQIRNGGFGSSGR